MIKKIVIAVVSFVVTFFGSACTEGFSLYDIAHSGVYRSPHDVVDQSRLHSPAECQPLYDGTPADYKRLRELCFKSR